MIQCNHSHKQYIGETKQYQKFSCVTIITLLTCNLFPLNTFNLTVTLYKKQGKHTPLRGETLEPHGLNKRDKT